LSTVRPTPSAVLFTCFNVIETAVPALVCCNGEGKPAQSGERRASACYRMVQRGGERASSVVSGASVRPEMKRRRRGQGNEAPPGVSEQCH